MRPFWLSTILIALGAACAEPESAVEPGPRVAVQTCFAPAGMGDPQTIEDVVRLINALEPPVTLPCVLETLSRPMELEASRNTFSAQPAYGPNNPRFFIHRGDLVLSVVPKGEGRPLLEFGMKTTPTRSIKGEIEFPVMGPLPLSAPFDRVDFFGVTTCAACHSAESAADSEAEGAFASDLIRTLRKNRIDQDYLEWAHSTCDPGFEPDRCAMWDGLMGFGDVIHTPIE